MSTRKIFASAAVTLVISMSAVFSSHASLIVSGGSDAFSWTARSLLTGAAEGGTGSPSNLLGNSIYHPSYPAYSGVVGMLMDYGDGERFVCSGTLMNDRRSILTAAHCVSGGAGTANPLSTTISFQPDGGLSPDERIYATQPDVVRIEVTDYFVNENYSGEVIDQNDVAVLRLAEEAPAWAISHDIYTEGDLTGLDFNVAGYGLRGDGNGLNSLNRTGYLREGDNMYDFAWGNELFNGFFTNRDTDGEFAGQNFFGFADVEFSYLSDFDNGLAINDTAGRIASALGLGGIFDDVGLGDREVGVAGGDSGGPNFINGLISGINSYGLSFGTNFGDIGGGLNSSFGEFSGYVPTFIHADFIRAAMVNVPVVAVSEPSMLALMSLGLFSIGASARRRKTGSSTQRSINGGKN
ncbi:trypsin-like serine protease [Rheinheimera baltica]|uniref:trypsin-like serine protease n=1 Tax=Rheinheimera baltica TaxID=67576 RepID=UPI00273E6E22|nr:trypsin-like serine protease [Rheinheimera baltica]MDP5144547.1 trypsin-like serine protease [Rheinheimera baltica]